MIPLYNRNAFRIQIIESLANRPVGQEEHMYLLPAENNGKWHISGVLLPILFRTEPSEEYVILFSKRSQNVPQPGDLCCPGGSPEPWIDRAAGILMCAPVLPFFWQKGIQFARRRDPAFFKETRYYLANALRESWEEIGLNPFDVEFLGTLPLRRLQLFSKLIFPMVGLIKKEKKFKLQNNEVEKIISIPIMDLLDPTRYAFYSVNIMEIYGKVGCKKWEFPCFVHYGEDGVKEILWGATYWITISFLNLIFNFTPPDVCKTGPLIQGNLCSSYLSGTPLRPARLKICPKNETG